MLKRLIEAHPQAATCLTAQYRMNDQIMTLCNHLIYEQRMTCATPEVASARLSIPNSASFYSGRCKGTHGKNDWLLRCMDPQHSVVFLNTDSMYSTPSPSSRRGVDQRSTRIPGHLDPLNPPPDVGTDYKGENIHHAEVEIVCQLVSALMKNGMDVRKGNGLGVISPYRSQVRALKSALSALLVREQPQSHLPQGMGSSNSVAFNASHSSGCVTGVQSGNIASSDRVTVSTGTEDGTGTGVGVGTGGRHEGGSSSSPEECEVSTVDSFQGRDMDAVIFSTVKNIQGAAVRSDILATPTALSHNSITEIAPSIYH